MTPVHLTTHVIRNFIQKPVKGKEVYFKGAIYVLLSVGNKYIHLKSEEGKDIQVHKSEVAAYTSGLEDSRKAYLVTMREHQKLVRSRQYLSQYFMKPKRYAFEQ
jgi:hypothetical protein